MTKRKRSRGTSSLGNGVAGSPASRLLRSASTRSQFQSRAQTEHKTLISLAVGCNENDNSKSSDGSQSDVPFRRPKGRPSQQSHATTSRNARSQRSLTSKNITGTTTRRKRHDSQEERAVRSRIEESSSKEPENGSIGSEEAHTADNRPPAVNSEYVPLPWKGRLGYACLCTYLRYSNPPIFCSRTTRIASILEHRHPLVDPSQPEHPTKNRPDKTKPADIRRGQELLERLALANCRDMIKLLRWNDKYGIKFLRLSSEAFPFASHAEYGYKLAPFASDDLRMVGQVVRSLGHRVTTHPGQFTQLGSPRQSVIEASVRDLEYHDEMLSLLDLPPQQNRDAVMVLHMGGVFGDKELTLSRFRSNYNRLSQSIKNRLVLENDDVSWSVHDLLPVCEELNIPLVLDFHHHNIIHDSSKVREGTHDIIELFPRIKATWARKNITQKMHYSEPNANAITPRERRKHSHRVANLPPCPSDMDLMIEAKDKEQAVFELMKMYKLPGHDKINTIVPHTREDINQSRQRPGKKGEEETSTDNPLLQTRGGETLPSSSVNRIAEAEVGMGGPENRVYWPPDMEHWLRPQKRAVADKKLIDEGSS